MNHEETKLLFNEYLAGELSNGEKTALESHLVDCSECRSALEEHRRYLDLLRGTVTELRPSQEFRKSLLEMAKEAPQVPRWTVRRVFAYAAAAVLSFGITFWAASRLFEPEERPDPAGTVLIAIPIPLDTFGEILPGEGAKLAVVDATRIRQDSGEVLYRLMPERSATIELPGGEIAASRGGELHVALHEEAGKPPIAIVTLRSEGVQLIAKGSSVEGEPGAVYRLIAGEAPRRLEEPSEGKESGLRQPSGEEKVEELPGARVEGTVLDSSRAPVPGAKVFLLGTKRPKDKDSWTLFDVEDNLTKSETVADAAGRFRVDGIEEGIYAVGTPRESGRALSIGALLVVGRVPGEIRDPFEQAAKGLAPALSIPMPKILRLATNESAEFPIETRPGGMLIVRAADEAGKAVSGAEITVVPGPFSMLGFGMSVHFWRKFSPIVSSQICDKDGSATFPGMLGPVEATAEAEGFYRGKAVGTCRVGEEEEIEIELEAQMGVTVRGRILDDAGNGIAAAKVMLGTQWDTFAKWDSLVADAKRPMTESQPDGSFAFVKVAPPGSGPRVDRERVLQQKIRIGAAAEGYFPSWTQPVSMPEETLDGVELRLGKGMRLRGRVTESGSGLPLEYVSIRLSRKGGNNADLPQANTSADGGFEIGPLPAEKIKIDIDQPDYHPWSAELDLSETSSLQPLEIQLEKAEWVIRGRVRDLQGKVPPYLRERGGAGFSFQSSYFGVWAYPEDPSVFFRFQEAVPFEARWSFPGCVHADYSSSSGEFTAIPPSEWNTERVWVVFDQEEREPQVQIAQKGGPAIEFRMDPEATSRESFLRRVRTKDRVTGERVLDPSVSAFEEGKPFVERADFLAGMFTMSLGDSATVQVDKAGSYTLMVAAKGYGHTFVEGVRFSKDSEEEEPLIVLLSPAGVVRGRVQRENGRFEPGESLWVKAFDSLGRRVSQKTVEADGSFVFDRLAGGSYRIEAGPGPQGFAAQQVQVGEGAEIELSLVLNPIPSLIFRLSESFRDAGGLLIVANASGRTAAKVVMRKGASVQKLWLAPGSYRTRFLGTDDRSFESRFSIEIGSGEKVISLETEKR